MKRSILKDPAIYKKINGIECVYMMTKDNGEEVYIPISNAITTPEHVCSKCGYTGDALQNHHIHGRKNSNETVLLCANCHVELHIKYGWNL